MGQWNTFNARLQNLFEKGYGRASRKPPNILFTLAWVVSGISAEMSFYVDYSKYNRGMYAVVPTLKELAILLES